MSRETLLLWPDDHADGDPPSLTLFPCAGREPRGGVMVLPGGAYGHLAEHEGAVVAERLSAAGFDAAVLRYRLGPRHQHPAMIHDAQRGMRLMRKHPAIRASRLAVLGFSAGGHLASTLAVHHDRFAADHDDLVSQFTARPDAAVLCYPVIDMNAPNVHAGSRLHLLGEHPATESIELLSTHKHVNAATPPTFLWHTADDGPVPVQNSLQFAAACREARVSTELHVYESGVHGLGLADDHAEAHAWFATCAAFLDRHLRAAT